MFWHRSRRLTLRQWTYAPEFRIPVYGPEDFSAMLLAVLCEQERAAGSERGGGQAGSPGARAGAAKGISEAAPEAGPAAGAAEGAGAMPAPAGDAASDGRLAIEICNGCFRIRRNALVMSAAPSGEGKNGGKEIRSIARTLERMDDFLKQSGVEYRDLTGQVYDPGRQDFESIGEPEEVAGLKVRTIIQIERPAILVSGKLVQRARGVVGKPAS